MYFYLNSTVRSLKVFGNGIVGFLITNKSTPVMNSVWRQSTLRGTPELKVQLARENGFLDWAEICKLRKTEQVSANAKYCTTSSSGTSVSLSRSKTHMKNLLELTSLVLNQSYIYEPIHLHSLDSGLHSTKRAPIPLICGSFNTILDVHVAL